ncbi:MAG: hypothetical protein IT379_39105 [Deltaproteobacteria bacterium]|nr:hypothetical protein [Deltaproteobacteria bacterium]
MTTVPSTTPAMRTVFRRSRWGALVGCLMFGAFVAAMLWLTWPPGYALYEPGRALGVPTFVRLFAIAGWVALSANWLRRSRFEIVFDADGVTDGMRDAQWAQIDSVSLKRLAGIPILVVHLRDERRELEIPLAGVADRPEDVLARVESLLAQARARSVESR